jgi:hypothetical protein
MRGRLDEILVHLSRRRRRRHWVLDGQYVLRFE